MIDIEKVIALRKQIKTYQQIGDTVGVSRERVRQILKKYTPSLIDRRFSPQGISIKVTRFCKYDQKPFAVYEKLKQKYCSRKCGFDSRVKYMKNPYQYRDAKYEHFAYEMQKKYNADSLAKSREKTQTKHKHLYANDPVYKARVNSYTYKYIARNRDRINKKYRDRRHNDPEYCQKVRDYQNKRNQEKRERKLERETV